MIEVPREWSKTMTTTQDAAKVQSNVLDSIRGTRDALSVTRAFGESYEVDGVTIIPVARVAGGAGGGAGEGIDEQEESKGSGFGSGFGMGVHPIGVYKVQDGNIEWKPSVDVNLLVKGGQVLAGIISVCVAIVLWRRW